MSSKIKLETLEERAERMALDNPGKSVELCSVVVEKNWEEKSERIKSRIPERFVDAEIEDLGFVMDDVIGAVGKMLAPVGENEIVGVVLSGPAGTGKTYAMYAIINRLRKRNPESIAYVTTYSAMMTSLKSEFANGSYLDMGSVWDRINNESGLYRGVLFIDDLSSQKLTDFEVDKMMMFLETRLNSYLPFVITTNIVPEDFKNVFGERLASRLFGYAALVELDAADKRELSV